MTLRFGNNKRILYSGTVDLKTKDNCNFIGLYRAIKNNELLLHYQPKIDGRTGALVGVEALVRWQHPEKGLLYPSEFIPDAEESGIIKYLDEWVLKNACNQLKNWQELGYANFHIAVNLSARQFNEKHLPEIIKNVLMETRLDPSYLELEITETSPMKDPDLTASILKELINMGINISIDDFGIGYSSIYYLKHFPAKYLKIDHSFIADMVMDKNTLAIIKAVIEIAHILSLKVIAEGIETKEQLELLQGLNCDELQGFYIGKPLPVEEAEKNINFTC